MFCLPGCLRTFVFVLLLVLLPLSEASAHCFVGARFFPATLATDDPCVADEMSLPTVAWSRTGDIPPATQWAISGDLAKRITEDFGISIGEGWTQIGHSGGPTMAGFGDLETTFQYQLRKRRPPPRWHTEPARRPQTRASPTIATWLKMRLSSCAVPVRQSTSVPNASKNKAFTRYWALPGTVCATAAVPTLGSAHHPGVRLPRFRDRNGASERSAALCHGRRDERGQAGDYMLRLE